MLDDEDNCNFCGAFMAEQPLREEEDPSAEWIYDKANDMWVSHRQGVAIDGVTFRRMVAVKSYDAERDRADETPADTRPTPE